MTIKENLDKVIKEFNAGYGSNPGSKPNEPSKPGKPASRVKTSKREKKQMPSGKGTYGTKKGRPPKKK